jgi:NADP-dependent 3-hydroxy acid dehydrogenase YdfG
MRASTENENPNGSQPGGVWLATGASAGIGRTLAESALRRGHKVVATARRLADLSSLSETQGVAVFPLELDVNDEAADADTVSYAVETLGHLDVVVNKPIRQL